MQNDILTSEIVGVFYQCNPIGKGKKKMKTEFVIYAVTKDGKILFLSGLSGNFSALWNTDSKFAMRMKLNSMTHEEKERSIGELAFADENIKFCGVINL